MEFQQIIQTTRTITQQAQASYSSADFRRDRIKKPFLFWIIRDGRFDNQLSDQRILLERGKVVWGAIIQANNVLFEENGAHACLPAAVMYSEDPVYDDQPDQLIEQAHGLFDLKGKTVSPEVQAFADKLADEMVADLKLPIPVGMTGGALCYYATLLIARKHLPVNYLNNGFFPVLIAPQETPTVMILPSQYWEPGFRQAWSLSR